MLDTDLLLVSTRQMLFPDFRSAHNIQRSNYTLVPMCYSVLNNPVNEWKKEIEKVINGLENSVGYIPALSDIDMSSEGAKDLESISSLFAYYNLYELLKDIAVDEIGIGTMNAFDLTDKNASLIPEDYSLYNTFKNFEIDGEYKKYYISLHNKKYKGTIAENKTSIVYTLKENDKDFSIEISYTSLIFGKFKEYSFVINFPSNNEAKHMFTWIDFFYYVFITIEQEIFTKYHIRISTSANNTMNRKK